MAIFNPLDIGKASAAAAASSIAFTTTATVPAGGKIWVMVGWFSAGEVVLNSVSDGVNTYRIDLYVDTPSNIQFGIASVDVPAGLASGATITATFASATPTFRHICGAYSTGVMTGDVDYGGVNKEQSSSVNWDSGVTTVAAGDILIGCSYNAEGNYTSTPDSPNVEIHDFNNGIGTAFTSTYRLSGGGSINASGVWSGGTFMAAAAVAYPAASGVPGVAAIGAIG